MYGDWKAITSNKERKNFECHETTVSCNVHHVVTVLYAMQFHGLDAILDRPGTLYLDLMCSVFLARELVSILWHLFTTGLFIVFLAVFN